jgi:hypothetical protein
MDARVAFTNEDQKLGSFKRPSVLAIVFASTFQNGVAGRNV